MTSGTPATWRETSSLPRSHGISVKPMFPFRSLKPLSLFFALGLIAYRCTGNCRECFLCLLFCCFLSFLGLGYFFCRIKRFQPPLLSDPPEGSSRDDSTAL